jgi:hypothetical protein
VENKQLSSSTKERERSGKFDGEKKMKKGKEK